MDDQRQHSSAVFKLIFNNVYTKFIQELFNSDDDDRSIAMTDGKLLLGPCFWRHSKLGLATPGHCMGRPPRERCAAVAVGRRVVEGEQGGRERRADREGGQRLEATGRVLSPWLDGRAR